MFGSSALDIAIGLCLFFLLVSLLCSAIREAGETLLKSRARDLERGLRMMLDDPDGSVMMPSLMNHGLLSSLFAGEYDFSKLVIGKFSSSLGLSIKERAAFPSYIPSRQFAAAFLDLVGRGYGENPHQSGTAPITVASIRASVDLLPSARLKQVVLSALDTAGDDIEKARTEIGKWFDGSMERVCGWYKRRTQVVLFLIGLVVAVGLNLDTLTIASRLNTDPALRAAAVAEAEGIVANAKDQPTRVEQIQGEFIRIGYPMGWLSDKDGFPWPGPQACEVPDPKAPAVCTTTATFGFKGWLALLVGWLITALSVTLGAPFWFDLLGKFISIRSTIKATPSTDPVADPAPTTVTTSSAQQTPDKTPDVPSAQTAEANGTEANESINLPDLIAEIPPTWSGSFQNAGEVKL